MGKCVSKQPSVVNLADTDFIASKGVKRKFSEISDCSPLYEDDENSETIEEEGRPQHEGQSESKKNSKRAGPETKGTAMSFGFRKKFQSSNKKNANVCKEKEKEKEILTNLEQFHQPTTVISNQEVIEATTDAPTNDKNGNEEVPDLTQNCRKNRNHVKFILGTESTSEKQEIKRVAQYGVSSKRETGGVAPAYKGSRFGFRSSNVVRPASVGLMPKITDFEENIENNNITAQEKRRSKSASGTQRLQTINRYQIHDQNASDAKNFVPKIASATTSSVNNRNQWFLQPERSTVSDMQTRHQSQSSGFSRPIAPSYTIVNSGLHTNVIVKPTPQPAAASVSKFTLHTTSLPKPQYPVPISLSSSRAAMDSKNAKQVVNNSRKGFQGPREISTDSGIASLDNNFEFTSGNHSPTRHHHQRSRPRNLEMVFNSRHKFEVRDLDDSLSCDSVEPLSLPKLPSVFSSDNQTVPLSGLIRSTITTNQEPDQQDTIDSSKTSRTHSDAESIEEEKLFRDRSTSEKGAKNPSIKDYNTSSKNSSPGSSRASWCNAGESLALKDCSSFSLSSSDESKDNQNDKTATEGLEISSITISEKPSLLSSLTVSVPKIAEKPNQTDERPNTLSNIAETKFAEMAAAVSDILLDDETSPTDSLVSSTESDEMMLKKAKKKFNEDIQEKDIDEISPEIDLSSPLSPGTPTHASNSFSLSDGGRDFLIDDEIADQPALLFSDKADLVDAAHLHSLTDTPTLIETNSTKSTAQISKPKLTSLGLFEGSNRTPISKRRLTLLTRAESLDTLSPCESIASDDLMMDFETSSMDSIDRVSHSIKSRSGSALQAMDDAQLWSELEAKSGEVIREWNNILRVHRSSKDSIISQLPARATRLLNRSRLQQSQLSNAGSDSPKSIDSLPRKHSRASSLHLSGREPISSSDDLIFSDKSLRNSMIQDVLYFKKQLIRLRRILQDTETLNPFDQSNGQFFASCGLDNGQYSTDDKELSSLASSTADDPKQELADLRRQVVYLQGQLDDRDRTIRLQRNIIDKLEADKDRSTISVSTSISEKERVNSATQTDRVRPLSIGQEGLARSKPEFASYTTYFPATTSTIPSPTAASPSHASRRHTVISTTFTNLNHIASACPSRRASLSLEKLTYKPVKTTLIGEPLKPMTPTQSNTATTPTRKLTNGFNGLNGYQNSNGSCPARLTNGGHHQQAIKNCHVTKNIHFDDLKQDHRTQTITIV